MTTTTADRYLDWCCYNCDNLQWADDPPTDDDYEERRRECATCDEVTDQFAAIVIREAKGDTR